MVAKQAFRRGAFKAPVMMAAALGLASLGGCGKGPQAEAKPVAVSPPPAPADPRREDRIELSTQERCAAQAERAFNKSIAQTQGTALENARKYFFDHYNPTLGRCFVEIHYASKFGQQVELRNAFEYTIYGLIDVTAGPSHSIYCTLSPPGAKAPSCSSVADFNQFIDRYMERGSTS
jgi:hypothetical protein